MNIKRYIFILVTILLLTITMSGHSTLANGSKEKELSDTLEELKTSLLENPDSFNENIQYEYLIDRVIKELQDNIKQLEGKYDEDEVSREILKTNLKVLKLKDTFEWYTIDKSKKLPYKKEANAWKGYIKQQDSSDEELNALDSLLSLEEIVKAVEESEELEEIVSYQQEAEKMEIAVLLSKEKLTLEEALERTKQTLHEQKTLVKNLLIIDNPYYQGLGNFMWPVKQDHITSPFGKRNHPIDGVAKLHRGTDIRASVGDKIFASDGGVVELSRDYGGYGKAVIIDHQNGYKTLYAHNSKLLVKTGQTVKMGEVIAEAGSTGASTGPHLHFEIIKNGEHLNPMEFFTK